MSRRKSSLNGIASKGSEITSFMLTEEVGSDWRFGDILTLAMQVMQNLPPGPAASLAAQTLERVLHNAFVKAKIPPYDAAPKHSAQPSSGPITVSREDIGP